MRLFIAFDVPLPVQERIRDLQRQLPQGCRPTPPRQCHCTLKFLGDVQDPAPFMEELTRVEHAPFTCTLDGVNAFPSLVRPRTLFVEGPRNPALQTLARKVDDATKEIAMEKRFYAHVTVARCDDGVRLPALAFPNVTFPVTEFVLYQSILRSDGAEHIPLRRYALRG